MRRKGKIHPSGIEGENPNQVFSGIAVGWHWRSWQRKKICWEKQTRKREPARQSGSWTDGQLRLLQLLSAVGGLVKGSSVLTDFPQVIFQAVYEELRWQHSRGFIEKD